ncbi:hypothetical protein NPIL_225561 [Nephila pilipes]|uniref:Uncharacterized protein n=1 Tax=Nephila pilipes TaxID=299642 RepID=A0A8X6QQ12_NEPPI|nr:hypothetical protein NPIL_225561 [Nephila pilipes]
MSLLKYFPDVWSLLKNNALMHYLLSSNPRIEMHPKSLSSSNTTPNAHQNPIQGSNYTKQFEAQVKKRLPSKKKSHEQKQVWNIKIRLHPIVSWFQGRLQPVFVWVGVIANVPRTCLISEPYPFQNTRSGGKSETGDVLSLRMYSEIASPIYVRCHPVYRGRAELRMF